MTVTTLGEAFSLNPAVPLKKGSIAPAVGMSTLRPFTRDVRTNEYKPYSGGARFLDGDVLMARITPSLENGKTAVYRASAEYRDSPAFGSTEFIVIRGREGISSSAFAYYMFTSPAVREFAISSMTGTSGRQRVQHDALAALEVDLPSIEEQREIATTLGALDDRIESNQRIVELAEDLGSGILGSHLSLDAYGFPEYDDERRLGDILDVLETGSRPRGGALASGTVSLGAENIQSAGVNTVGRFKYVPESYAARMKRGRLEDEDILVYKDGGKPGNFVPHVSAFGYGSPVERAVINEHVYRVRAASPVSQGLLYWLLRSNWMDQEMRKRGTGVAIPGLNSTNFRDLPIPALLTQDLAALNARLEPLLRAMLHRGGENRVIAALRDALLPEMLSGRIVVPEAGATTEAAA